MEKICLGGDSRINEGERGAGGEWEGGGGVCGFILMLQKLRKIYEWISEETVG